MDDEIDSEVRSIVESLCRIMSIKKDAIHSLPRTDALMLALTGEMLGQMVRVEMIDPERLDPYLVALAKAGEDSFLDHKIDWIEILAANQDKVIGAFAGGMIG